jgi:predicted N-acetyltransferase YhbS
MLDRSSSEEVERLVASVFTSSEGEKEGSLIGGLAGELSSSADNHEIICIGAFEQDFLVGVIFWTRLGFDEPIEVYMLAPVAVRTEYQGRGVGQALINYGLEELRSRSVAVVITYGDPAFYSKLGFQTLSEDVIQAPLALSMPEGWLGQSLTGGPVPTLNSRPRCVPEFDNPVYW